MHSALFRPKCQTALQFQWRPSWSWKYSGIQTSETTSDTYLALYKLQYTSKIQKKIQNAWFGMLHFHTATLGWADTFLLQIMTLNNKAKSPKESWKYLRQSLHFYFQRLKVKPQMCKSARQFHNWGQFHFQLQSAMQILSERICVCSITEGPEPESCWQS